MRYLVRLGPTGARQSAFLASIRGLAKSVGVDLRNPKWTSYGALELDIFCPSQADLEIFLAAVDPVASPEFVTDLNQAPHHMADAEIFAKARTLFNTERYWECHEVLEGLWRQKHGDEKRFLQGVILVCAAFVHHQKGEEDVALGVLDRAAKQLDFHSRVYGGFDVLRLSQEVQQITRTRRFSHFKV